MGLISSSIVPFEKQYSLTTHSSTGNFHFASGGQIFVLFAHPSSIGIIACPKNRNPPGLVTPMNVVTMSHLLDNMGM
ncbi:hypothetical protein DD238_006910 [Peronospora effusa]|uniref:Uncharacterized protein n=1 Tax=Peronospora effusa TaxID=542832 RepID=A0A3M6VD16_9STRA|nr:hypothetical protein DD238_006910 [Peronospora effusa]